MLPELSRLSADNKATGRFAILSLREINNRLTSIKLSAGIIASRTKNDDIEKYLDIISNSAGKIDSVFKESLKQPGVVTT